MELKLDPGDQEEVKAVFVDSPNIQYFVFQSKV